MTVKEMNKMERPRERALLEGISALSNRELLAIFIRTGTQRASALDLADELLHKRNDLVSLTNLTLQELMSITGIKEAKAVQLLACFELCKRISEDRMRQECVVNDEPQILCEWLMNHIGNAVQEHFVVLFLDKRGNMIAHKDIFIGTASKSFANPREIFMKALSYNSAKIICAHNHPSGNVTPSISDRKTAQALERAGNLLGIKVIDHLIVSDRNYYSFREHSDMIDQSETRMRQFEKDTNDLFGLLSLLDNKKQDR